MGQKMEQGIGLTSRQKKFLAVVLQTQYLLKHFYLTGGTALSSWYLHHRESLDIDLFSEQEVNVSYINQWLRLNKHKIGFQSITHEEQLGFNFFQLKYSNGELLKIDFCYFPSERIEKGINWRGLTIDSIYDIAVNKFQTIDMSPRAKDYIDLYLILKENKWSVEKLRTDAAIKHGINTSITHIAKQFLRVVEFSDFPKMLIPFDQKEMEDFFLTLAKSLENKIFK